MPTAKSTRSSGVIWISSALVGLVACGPEPQPNDPTPAVDPDPTTGAEAPPPPANAAERSLAADARYEDLLRAARSLDERRDSESDAGCLLGRASGGWRLEADLAVAIRPLPETPPDLDARFGAAVTPVNLLTRWGALGSGDPAHPTLSTVTTTLPPSGDSAAVWIVTDQGVYLRDTAAPIGDVAPGPPTVPEGTSLLFVAAEAGLPLARLAEVLAEAPAALAGRIGLAVVLDEGTRLPEPRAEAESAEVEGAVCPDGLPALDESAPLGELRPRTIVSSLGPLRQGAEICVSTAQGRGAAGGRVVLALRIGPEGAVTEACAVEDATEDPSLRGCLARAARATAFPAPEPPGFVDVQLPLVLAPVASQLQRPLCP